MRKLPPKLHASMGAAVLKHLSRFVSMEGLLTRYEGTQEGFVAGQAVASAISELFYDGLGVVYNDVDVFLLSPRFERPDNQILSTLEFEKVELAMNYRQLVLELTTVYEVMRTRRQGMLNEVLCRPCGDFVGYPTYAALAFLQSFDLNCVQVGVRLSDGALVWTQAYEQFLATREMLVMNVKTPMHTAIRWFRKKNELEGVFGHDDRTMELLASVAQRVGIRLTDRASLTASCLKVWDAQSRFGPQYAQKAREVQSRLGAYFRLQAVDEGGRFNLFTLAPVASARKELLDFPGFDMTLPTYARALQGHWKRHISEQLVQRLTPVSVDARDAEDADQATDGPRTELRVKPGVHYWNIAREGVLAVEALQNARNARTLEKTLEAHRDLFWMTYQMSAGQQFAAVTAMNKLAAKEGQWVYGVFEQLSGDLVTHLASLPAEEVAQAVEGTFHQQVKLFEDQVAALETPLQPLLPNLSLDGYEAQELLTFKDLADEGTRQHHCVAGYFGAVLQGRTRIIRLTKGSVRHSLTLQLEKVAEGWSARQLQGLQNRDATAKEKAVGQRYANIVNLQVWAAKWHVSLPLWVAKAISKQAPLWASERSRGLTGEIDWETRFRVEQRLRKSWKPRLFGYFTEHFQLGGVARKFDRLKVSRLKLVRFARLLKLTFEHRGASEDVGYIHKVNAALNDALIPVPRHPMRAAGDGALDAFEDDDLPF